MSVLNAWLRTLTRTANLGVPRRGERGASAVEYGLLIAGIAALIVVVVFAFGDTINDVLFEDTCQEMVDAGGIGDCT